MALKNSLSVNIRSELTGEVGLAAIKSLVNEKQATDLTSVPTDAVFTATGIIGDVTPNIVEYDLDGALTDPLGDPVTFAKVMALYIVNNSLNPMTIGGLNNIPMIAAGGVMNIASLAYFMYTDEAGLTVTDATADLITITGTDADTFDLVLIGSST
jgi:hypothetical protein